MCPRVDSASKNEYQVNPGGKGRRCVRLTTDHLHVPMSRNLGALTSWNPVGLLKALLLQWLKYTELHKETDSFIIAERNQTINALIYEKYVLHDLLVTTDMCVRRNYDNKTREHSVSGCQILAPTERRTMHDRA